MATLVPPDGPVREVYPANGVTFTLEELQGYVGGYIEALRVSGNHWLIINEDGKGLGLPVNDGANLYLVAAGRRLHVNDYIVGPAVICTTEEADGET